MTSPIGSLFAGAHAQNQVNPPGDTPESGCSRPGVRCPGRISAGSESSVFIGPETACNRSGGSNYLHSAVSLIDESDAKDGYTIFLPDSPKPESADVVVFMHGLAQTNPMMYGGWIRHLVQKGNIVIYPKYQTLFTLSGEFNDNAAKGIRDALVRLEASGPVEPRLDHFAIVGHSYGGTMAANLTILRDQYELPSPSALMVTQGYDGADMRLESYAGIPDDTKMLIVVGNEDIIVENSFGERLMDAARVDPSFKNFITQRSDRHNFFVPLLATHDAPLSVDREFDDGDLTPLIALSLPLARTDGTDYFAFWKLSEALLDCAFRNENFEYAFGNTSEQRYMGEWSDGQPVTPLEIRIE